MLEMSNELGHGKNFKGENLKQKFWMTDEKLKEMARETALEILCFDRGHTPQVAERIFNLLKKILKRI